MYRIMFWLSLIVWNIGTYFDVDDFRHDYLWHTATYMLIASVYLRVGLQRPYTANYTISVSRDTPMPARSFGEP